MAILNFDSTNVPVAQALDPIPAGWYPCAIVASEVKPTGNGQGAYLELEEEVIEGPYKGRKVYDRLNLQNLNPIAVEIAYKTLSAICHAVNVIQVADSSQLHNRPLMVKVALRSAGMGKDNQMHEASNEVKGYKAMGQDAAPAAPAAPAFAPPPAAAPAAPAAPAWQPPAPAAPAAPAFPAPAPAPAAAPVAPAGAPPWAAAAQPAAPAAAPAMPVAPAAPPWAK
jgi:hypothetical protein